MSCTLADLPDQAGRTVVVTARALAAAGASVICACRDVAKGRAAVAGLAGRLEVRSLDLADLSSGAAFAAGLEGKIDVLSNNAGVMAPPKRYTLDGFEMQFGTNYPGPFALTAQLFPRITDRVVSLSSLAHRVGRIRLDDPNWQRGYQRWLAYGQSKLADLMFAFELQHRLREAGSSVRSVAAHPGYADTNLQSHTESVQDYLMGFLNKIVAPSAEVGALPTLYAATVLDLPGGSFVGPGGPGWLHGYPRPVGSSAASHDRTVQRKLWILSERLTGARFSFATLS
jgi:NAD(P)-dependent dehydrogenase (short-subunit alcohol dehydrogenase family)